MQACKGAHDRWEGGLRHILFHQIISYIYVVNLRLDAIGIQELVSYYMDYSIHEYYTVLLLPRTEVPYWVLLDNSAGRVFVNGVAYSHYLEVECPFVN